MGEKQMNYDNRLEIRLSKQQKEKLYQLAGETSTISELIRKRFFNEPTRTELKKNFDIRNELQRMGNNLNQIALVLNSIALYKSPLTASQLIDFKRDVQTAISEVRSLKNQFK